jgi:hypothetical protein
MTVKNFIVNLFRKKPKYNKFGEIMEVTAAQKAAGVSIINGRRCLHGLNREQADEMNSDEFEGVGLDEYKKLKGL